MKARQSKITFSQNIMIDQVIYAHNMPINQVINAPSFLKQPNSDHKIKQRYSECKR